MTSLRYYWDSLIQLPEQTADWLYKDKTWLYQNKTQPGSFFKLENNISLTMVVSTYYVNYNITDT